MTCTISNEVCKQLIAYNNDNEVKKIKMIMSVYWTLNSQALEIAHAF